LRGREELFEPQITKDKRHYRQALSVYLIYRRGKEKRGGGGADGGGLLRERARKEILSGIKTFWGVGIKEKGARSRGLGGKGEKGIQSVRTPINGNGGVMCRVDREKGPQFTHYILFDWGFRISETKVG